VEKKINYKKIGKISFNELIRLGRYKHAKYLTEFVPNYIFNKFELLSKYNILESEINKAVLLKENHDLMYFEVFLDKKYIIDKDKIIKDVKKIIDLENRKQLT